ncbi:MAG: hypothetical protein E6I52_07670 [Chloroflexi bacterium]|nr:MAG: hypothetical protein E6I52_07670 [Chloroflexota bacterium]
MSPSSRAPATVVTALALALINVGLAALVVDAVGAPSFAPPWVALVLLVTGVLAGIGAVMLWRQYLTAARGR